MTEQKDDPQPASSAANETIPEQQTVPNAFSTELLEISPEQRADFFNRLALNPAAHTTADVLSSLGFRNDEGKLSFIRDHIVWPVSEQDILHTLKEIFAERSETESAPFFRKLGTVTNSRALRLIAKTDPETDGKPFWHTEWSFLFPFQNGLLKVESNRLELVPYAEAKVLVPAEAIKPHSLDLTDETVKKAYWQESDFYKLTLNQATDPKTNQLDGNLHEAIMMALAKTCHLHFNPVDPCAVIISEQTEPGQRNAGGTGKGILMQAVTHMGSKVSRIDGKNFDIKYPHALQGITAETRVVWVDEVDETEEVLNAFYNGLTDGFMINPKNCKPLVIPPERAPRVVFTTNSPGTGTNDSDLRRRFDVPLFRWYNSNHQPTDDFGKVLFGPEWTDEDWNRFYLVMAIACFRFLEQGCATGRMPRCKKAKLLLEQAALNEIDGDLREHFEELYGDSMEQGTAFNVVSKKDLEQFKHNYPGSSANVSNSTAYNNFLEGWLRLKGWNLERNQTRVRVDGKQVRAVKAIPQRVEIKPAARQTPPADTAGEACSKAS
ncbi:MAG: ATP-binding protein [Candidatus Syntrophosphaera sp.]|nr:ATP-binding protein [Candidatus Syntrophosphaera sp.]